MELFDVSLLLFPLLAAAGGALAFGLSSMPAARQHAMTLVLAILLFSFLAALLPAAPSSVNGRMVGLGVLLSLIIAAPLLDRARLIGLAAASVAGGLFLPTLLSELTMDLPSQHRVGSWLALIIAANLVALVGTCLLPRHPARLGNALQPMPQTGLAVGHALLAILIGLQAVNGFATLVGGLAAALIVLLIAQHHHHPQRFRLTSEALLAGVVACALAPHDMTVAVLLAAGASYFVWQGPGIARALRIDDPAHLIGSLLMPALLGLLLPGMLDLAQLAPQLRVLGMVLLAALLALPIWPMAMVLFGLAASPNRVRAGLDFQL